jgi:hypothetical protein
MKGNFMQDEERKHLKELQWEKLIAINKYSNYYTWADFLSQIAWILFLFSSSISVIVMFFALICSFIVEATAVGSITIICSYIIVIAILCIPVLLLGSWYATRASDRYHNKMDNIDVTIKYFTKALNINLDDGETED